MSKKFRGVMFFLLGIFFIILLFNQNKIEQENITLLLQTLNIGKFIFGKTIWFVSIFLVGIGIVDFIFNDMKIKFHKSKVVALVIWYLASAILLIKKYVAMPFTTGFSESARELLSIGFNGQSGGFIGALVSMPLYKVIHLPILKTILNVIIGISIVVIFKEVIILVYTLLVGIIKYYMSDDYKKKMQILKAKKLAEKTEYIDSQKKRREELREKLIESRKEKLSFEISRKPKETIFDKTKTYSESELIDKEKEWLQFWEETKHKKNEVKTEEIKEKNEKAKDIEILKEEELLNIITEDVKKEEITKAEGEKVEFKIDEEENSKKEINEIEKIKEYTEYYQDFEKIKDDKEYEDYHEYDSYNDEINYEDFDKKDEEQRDIAKNEIDSNENIQTKMNFEKEKFEYEENENSENKDLEKSIEEIFVAKPMDENKKQKIEMGITENIAHLEEALKEFGIEAKVVNYESGPTITRYEITIPKGVRVNKVTALQDDIQLSLAAKSVRIEAPIPGKNTIGIEVPNQIKEPVHFSNLIRNPKLEEGALNIILGKNIVGEDKIIDIAKMPHLLIAGQTGSGKSVAVNTLISTLISKKKDDEVKFIMIDPKMVEMMPYNGIPHLLVPVITDPQQAAIALKWTVNEMENRYRQLSENGVRNIISYNKLAYVEKMPYIVVIIDELADLMMVASGSVEESIARIAQKARAVGIHLVVATQRPSTDVITGMIKANLPSRISFSLRSQIDSRTILDSPGAEKLLGQGDMLLLENGSSNPERIQGAWISDEEVEQLTTALKSNKKVVYRNEILEDTSQDNKDVDPLFDNAIDVIKQEKKVSISLLQRKLNVGFNRAARIYEQLKDNGIISDDNQLLIDDFE